MIAEFLDVTPSDTWDDLRARLGRVLGLGGPIPSAALQRAIDDPEFAHHLLTSRNTPGFLDVLIGSVAKNEIAAPAPHISDAQLVLRATKAFLSWGKSGFTRVDQATYDRRMAACAGCDQLNTVAPERALYKLAGATGANGRSCKACGCVVSRKAAIPGEACPLASLTNPALNRWGEPHVIAAEREI
jgi:hypothetical protein